MWRGRLIIGIAAYGRLPLMVLCSAVKLNLSLLEYWLFSRILCAICGVYYFVRTYLHLLDTCTWVVFKVWLLACLEVVEAILCDVNLLFSLDDFCNTFCIILGDVCNALIALSYVTFESEVVSCSQAVVSVLLHLLSSFVHWNVEEAGFL